MVDEKKKRVDITGPAIVKDVNNGGSSVVLNAEDFVWYEENLVSNPERIEKVWEALDNLVVGEDDNKKIMFYVGLSAKLANPTGLLVSGDASIGKTHLVRETLKLFPPEMVMAIGGQSKRTMRHEAGTIGPDGENIVDLSGKILWFLEDKGGEDNYEDLRPILSRDQEEIRFKTVAKKKTKEGSETHGIDTTIIRGCPAFVTTSTKIERMPETGTRLIALTPDESSGQSERVLDFKRRKHQFPRAKSSFRAFHQFIRELECLKVWVPFADLIDLGSGQVNVRRDYDKIVTIIKCHALFNQKDRARVFIHGEEYLVAKLEDYLYTLRYILPVIAPTLYNLPKKIIDFYRALVQLQESYLLTELTHRNIAEKMDGLNQNSVRNYCYELVGAGWLIKEKEHGQNKYALKGLGSGNKRVLDVASVTLNRVSLHMISRSAKSTFSFINKGVTEKKCIQGAPFVNGVNYSFSSALVYYVYFFRVTPSNLLNIDELELISVINDVTGSKVSTVSLLECSKCGLKSPPAVLNESGLCDICSGFCNPGVTQNGV